MTFHLLPLSASYANLNPPNAADLELRVRISHWNYGQTAEVRIQFCIENYREVIGRLSVDRLWDSGIRETRRNAYTSKLYMNFALKGAQVGSFQRAFRTKSADWSAAQRESGSRDQGAASSWCHTLTRYGSDRPWGWVPGCSSKMQFAIFKRNA